MNGNVDADVVVVGAGLAGLTAANRLAQRGRRVIVLEAGEDDRYLCNSRIASGSFNLAHIDPTLDSATLRAAIMADTEGAADPDLADAVASVAKAAMDWLRVEGGKFIRITRGERAASWSMAPPRPAQPGFGWQGRGPDLTLQCLGENFRKRGGKLMLGTRAQRLRMDGGRCTGIETWSGGRSLTLQTFAVVLADGGFQGNPDLVRRFISPRPDRLVSRNAKTGRGDALLMAEAAGARLVGTDRFYGHLLVQEALTNDKLWPYPTIDSLASSAIVVDRNGRRFLDEGMGGVAMTNALARLADPLSATTIFDHAQWQTTGRAEFTPPNPYVETMGGTVTRTASIEDLARALGLPPDSLADTVRSYNRAVEGGNLSAVSPPRTPGRLFGILRSSPVRTPVRPIQQAPFYGIRLAAGLTYTMGGIVIDARTRVLGRNGPIAGLFAAGACTGGLEGGPMAGYIGGLCKALSLGYIAGDHAGADTYARQQGEQRWRPSDR